MQIGQTIKSQISAMSRFAFLDWGVKEVVFMNDGLKFKTSLDVKWKGYVYIQYDAGLDLYTVIFAKIKKHMWVEEKRLVGVFASQLVEIIDRKVLGTA